jgi:streptogramin lyase
MKHWLKATPLLWLVLAAPAAAAPTVTEFPLPTAAAVPEDIVLGPDGKLWFAEKDADKIGRVTPGNPPLIEEFDVPANFTDPFNITVGPDSKIWFSGIFNNAGGAGRMNPANPADTQGFGGFNVTIPAGIAKGPDNVIWLGDSAQGKVVRIDPATGTEETISDIPINGGSFNIRNLSPGPTGDPNVWVTDFGGNMAKVSPTGLAGESTTFDIPGDGAWDIVVGPDGNLWYTAPEGNNSKIGRITPAGEFGTQYDVTDAGDQLGITVGPDGALWFAQAVANDIGRMTLNGQFSEVKGLTPAARPEYIAQGPDNTLWFTEKDGNRIGRITGIELPQPPGGGQNPPPPPPPPPPLDTTAPDVTGLALSRTRFRLGSALPSVAAVRTGTRIRFTISEAATVKLRFRRAVPGRLVGGRCRRPTRLNRSRPRCTRLLSVRGSVSLAVQPGARRIKFAGRLSARRTLKPGRYRMTLTARDAAGNVSKPDRARFRLLPRRR